MCFTDEWVCRLPLPLFWVYGRGRCACTVRQCNVNIMQPLKVIICSWHGKVVERSDYPDDSQFKVTDPNALMSASMPSQTHAVNRSSCQPFCLATQ